MITYKFNTWEEVGTFVAWCEENEIPCDFNKADKWAKIPEEWEIECNHFIEYEMPEDD